MRRQVRSWRLHARFSPMCIRQKEEVKSIVRNLQAANFGAPVALTGVILVSLVLQLS
jgi:hypothetical protein